MSGIIIIIKIITTSHHHTHKTAMLLIIIIFSYQPHTQHNIVITIAIECTAPKKTGK